MQSLVEIYDLQQQVKEKISQKKYQDIEALFAPLSRKDLQNVLQFPFIFNSQVEGLDSILSQLQEWQQETPHSYYPYVFFASFWFITAANQRGKQTIDRVTPAQRQNCSAANDQFFYWALKTLEFNPQCETAYTMLLEASGYFSMPEWLDFLVTKPIRYSCESYNEEAVKFISSFTTYSIPHGSININLPSPSEEEERFIPFYWLRRILAIAPDHMISRKVVIKLLSPRWYGGEKYEDIDYFLASDYCSGLSELDIKILQREKEYDQLTSYNTLPLLNYRKELKRRASNFIDLINSPLTKDETSRTLLEYVYFCNHVLETDPKAKQSAKDDMVESVYQSLHHIVKLASPWFLFYQSEEIFNQLISFMKLYEFDDKSHVFDDIARQTQFRNLTSPIDVLYSTFAANFTLASISLFTQRESLERYYMLAEKNFDYYIFRLHIFMLCKMGYASSIKPVLERFAIENRATSASLLFYEIYHGNVPGMAGMLSIHPDENKEREFLDIAVKQGSTHAILIKSRDLESLIERSTKPSVKSELALERERLLKQNIQLGDAVSQYDYACSLISSSEEQQIIKGLFIEAPKVLAESRVRLDQLAYIAYLYAFCAFNGRGMRKNIFVMDFWMNMALAWYPDLEYQDFYTTAKHAVGIKPFYNSALKKGRGKIPEEMKKIMNSVAQ
jgi:hypothetical protein